MREGRGSCSFPRARLAATLSRRGSACRTGRGGFMVGGVADGDGPGRRRGGGALASGWWVVLVGLLVASGAAARRAYARSRCCRAGRETGLFPQGAAAPYPYVSSSSPPRVPGLAENRGKGCFFSPPRSLGSFAIVGWWCFSRCVRVAAFANTVPADLLPSNHV
jgi:hypothetical protein